MKICLDAGHYGKYNRSPVVKSYYESEMTWKLHLMLKEELERYGFEVITTRKDQKKDLAVYERGKLAKGCDLFISIHSNAASGASPDYAVACCQIDNKQSTADDVSVTLGKKLADVVNKLMGSKGKATVYRRKGNNGDYYGVLRGAMSVGVPGILMEHGFHTNKANTEWLMKEENLKKLAEAEAQTIAEHFGLKLKKTEETQKPPQNAVQSAQGGFVPYKVKVICEGLNIRKTPVWASGDVVGVIRDKGVYTITAEKMLGTTKFGRLKSGAGWISLGKKYVKKL